MLTTTITTTTRPITLPLAHARGVKILYFLDVTSCFSELSDDEGDVERLQLLESGSSDVSFMSHDVSQWLMHTYIHVQPCTQIL